jgi:hypothetical protein
VLSYLALQDKRYAITNEYLSNRVRVDDNFLRTAQDDSSIVFSTPMSTDDGDLPFVFSFKLAEGKLAPSPSKFAIQKINTEDVWAVNIFEIYNDKILYARC